MGPTTRQASSECMPCGGGGGGTQLSQPVFPRLEIFRECDRESFVCRNWKPEQPDNWFGHGLGGGEDCAHITVDGPWNDDVCRRPYRWVCETELDKTP